MTRSLFGSGAFQGESFQPHSLGLTFTDLKTTWDQYAPMVRTDLKTVRDQVAPLVAPAPTTTVPISANQPAVPAPAPTVSSPTNLVPGPAFQPKSSVPAILVALIGLAALGGGGYYLYSHGYFGKKKK